MIWMLWILGAYLLGSVPFGLLIGKVHGVDIREHGSGNIGATNLGRTCGKRASVICFVLDLGKGLIPTLGFAWCGGFLGTSMAMIEPSTSWMWLAVGVAALLGHVFPVYLRFKGGKGVATAFGVLLGVWPTLSVPALIAFGVWLAVMAVARTVSLASMTAACMVPVATAIGLWMRVDLSDEGMLSRCAPPMTITLLVAALVLVRHRSNIARLLKGDEHRVGPSG